MAPLPPHCASATFWSLMAAVDEQPSTHSLLLAVSSSSTPSAGKHTGTAVTPAGTSVGHVEEVQSWLQNEPAKVTEVLVLVTVSLYSSERQPAALHGSP